MKWWLNRPLNKRALAALLLLVPMPSIGAAFGLIIAPDTLTGVGVFAFSKIWILLLPVFWQKIMDRERFSLSPVRHGGWAAGAVSGLLISGLIAVVYWAMGGSLIDHDFLVRKLTRAGLASPAVYGAAVAYWIVVNSLLEEYVWRWFCVNQCARLFAPVTAVVLSAVFFTIHHIVAMQVYLPLRGVAVCAAGVFAGGLVWSGMYVKYKSIWPGYLSHAIVDLTVFAIGAHMLFGGV